MDVIQPGVAAPDFQGLTQDGQPISLATFRGRPVILFFYPKANSGGCSTEARGFAEHYTEFQRAGMDVIGISVDSIEEQKRFAENCHLPFPLVADHDKSIARQYGVLGFLRIAQRVTFFLDAGGKVVERVEGLLPTRHVQRALERLSESRPPP